MNTDALSIEPLRVGAIWNETDALFSWSKKKKKEKQKNMFQTFFFFLLVKATNLKMYLDIYAQK